MSAKTKVLVVGFGNVGRSVMELLPQYPDIEVVGVVTRRPCHVGFEATGVSVFDLSRPETYLNCGADVAIMCGGSKNDLPVQTPFFARHFNVVDSFDTHGHIGLYVDEETGQPMLGHLETVDIICHQSKHTGHIGIGWDPGTFSLMRALFGAGLAGCKVHAFYGLTPKGGLSMGHTNAIKRDVPGVIDARQYTHAKPEAIERVRNGENPELTDGDKHWRECKVVANEDDHERIRKKIIGMPKYYAPYDTTVTFVSQEELDREKSDLSHDGLVIISGPMGYMEFKNVWKSNPTGTAGFLLAYARATHRANQAGKYGCLTVLDTPVVDLLEDCGKKASLV